MKSKTKVLLSLTMVVLFAAIVVVGVAIVFASSRQSISSQISVSYKATQIEGKVSSRYYVGPTDTTGTAMTSDGTATGKTELIFHAADQELSPNTLNPQGDIMLSVGDQYVGTPDKRFVVFEYVFQNGLGTPVSTDFVAKLTFSGTATNIKISTLSSDSKITNFSTITSTVATPSNFTSRITLLHNEQSNYITTKYFYVRAEISDPIKHSSFSGKFDWEMKLDDPTVMNELFDESAKEFSEIDINKLVKKISGDASSSITNTAKLKQLATAGTTAAQMRAFSAKRSVGEDITITLGGLNWTVTYLSTDENGDPILTLWLDNCVQDAWTDRSSTEGEYYGFLNGGLYSDWSANWYDSSSATKTFPSNMYGASYIRAVALNNGGLVATSGTASKTYNQDPNSAFALFTMEENGLTKYLDTPSQVTWQEYGQNKKLDNNRSLPNENWSDAIPWNSTYNGEIYKFFDSNMNYAGKDYNATWANDYLWLPSLSEIGSDDTHIGIWDLSIGQRKNADGSTLSAGGTVGSTAGDAYNFYWLRSGFYGDCGIAYTGSYGGSGILQGSINHSTGVRPALHLNMKKIINDLGGSI